MQNQAHERILFKGGTVLTMDSAMGDFAVADVLVEGSRIAAVGPNLSADNARVIDATGHIVMPGFVNPHQHAWLGLLRGLLPNVETLNDYFEAIPFAIGRHYRPQDMHLATLLTSLTCLDAGITSILDAAHNSLSPEHTDAALDAFDAAGIRALHMVGQPVGLTVKHWPGEVRRLKRPTDAAVNIGLFANTPDAEHWATAREYGCRILSEFGNWDGSPSNLRALQAQGLLRSDNVFNHCVRLTGDDWRVLVETGVNVTVNPRSDALFGLETDGFPYQTALEYGIRPALGIDIDTSQSGDMFGEMHAAFAMQRMFGQKRRAEGDYAAPSPTHVRPILEAATIDGARVMGLERRTGSLVPGKQADLIMIRTDGISIFPSHNAVGNVVHMANRNDVKTVMVAGRLRKHEGQLVDVDLTTIRRATEASREYLFNASGYQPNVLEDAFPRLQPAN
ncbi:amidohydrolase family protein [Rothia nasimurium]|uniref:Amidohydrolase family protein n=1 Tax=Luteibacter anthropi TaxID=564369 RepID=A0A7X5UAZ4_9GAMM|nr:amidohydrolase family protein [Luteibacter anthropi]NII06923.1 amidohydrolase family protein [Luteibacter anthropi]